MRTAAVASVQTDDGWFDELVTGLRSVPERLRATTPPPPPEHVEERMRVRIRTVYSTLLEYTHSFGQVIASC